jgi:peroxiredoxin
MHDYSYQRKPPLHPFPLVLLGGLLAGLLISWSISGTPASNASLPLTSVPDNPPPTSTAESANSVHLIQVTPQIDVQRFAKKGELAPGFSLPAIDGKMIRLSDFKGKPVLINLWATWCPPCRFEMPGIEAAYEKYQDKGLVVLGIDFTVQDDPAEVQSFIDEFKLTFPVLLDRTGDVSVDLYHMRGLPTSFFIDSNGILQRIQVGELRPAELEQDLAEILPR